MDNYSFQQFWKDLNNGYQIYFDYMEIRYKKIAIKKR